MTTVTKTHLEEVWERVAQMPPRADGARWVPRDAIKVQPGLTPRDRMIDEDHVARLAENKDGLPPLLVQAGTLVLIGGHHRLYALEGRDIVPVVEVEVADGDLWDWAVRDNVAHGLPATARERNKNARKMWERHPDWSSAMLSEWTGVHDSTFRRWSAEAKHKAAQREEAEADSSYVQSDVSAIHTLSAPPRVLGKDGKSYPKTATVNRPTNEAIRASRPVVKTFDPDRDVPQEPWVEGVDIDTGEMPGLVPTADLLLSVMEAVVRDQLQGAAWAKALSVGNWDRLCAVIDAFETFVVLARAQTERAD